MSDKSNISVLRQSVDFLKDINLQEKDLERIFEFCESLFENPEAKEILMRIANSDKISSSEELELMLTKIANELGPKDLGILMKHIADKDEIIDHIQDLILDKLLSEI